jgi:lipoyl-dependent peroxiredoxin
LPEPHPAAENLFGAAWSARYMGAIQLAASQHKIKLPGELAVDALIDLKLADGAYFLRARLNVSVPGIERDQAQAPMEAVHLICSYSKAMHGNIDVATTLAGVVLVPEPTTEVSRVRFSGQCSPAGAAARMRPERAARMYWVLEPELCTVRSRGGRNRRSDFAGEVLTVDLDLEA